MKVIVVEDAVYIRKRLVDQLMEIENIEVVADTGNHDEAMELINFHMPDVAILDIRIENGSGLDILTWIKETHQGIKTIILTNYPFPFYRKKSIELGADYFLDKSQDFQKLPDIMKELCTES